MDFSDYTSSLSREQVLAALYFHPMTPPRIRETFANFRHIELPSDIPKFSILSRMYSEYELDEPRVRVHLSQKLDHILDTYEVEFSQNAISYESGDIETVLNYDSGYFLDDPASLDSIMCHVSDALSYMYTPSEEVQELVVSNVFESTIPGACLPLFTETMPWPGVWQPVRPRYNSQVQLSQLKDESLFDAIDFYDVSILL